jgi:hypothetical protein
LDATGTRTPKLEKLLLALLTIQLTSTCSERVFSVAGGFSTKIRNRLAYIMLNALGQALKWHVHLNVNPAWVSSFLRERIM